MYHIEEDTGTGSSLADKLERAVDDIEENNKDGVTIELGSGVFDLSSAGTLTLAENGITIEGSRDKDGVVTTIFKVDAGSSAPAIKVTGEGFRLSDVAFLADGSGSTDGVIIEIDGDKAVLTNTSFDIPSSSSGVKTAVDAAEGKTLTLEDTNLKGGAIASSGNLTAKNSTFSDASLDIRKGDVKLENSMIEGDVNAESGVGSVTIEGSTIRGDSTLSSKDTTITKSAIEGKLTVEKGTLSVTGSELSGDITIKSSVEGAAITSSKIDTSEGSDSLTTGADLTITKSKISKGSGLFVIPKTEGTVRVTISESSSDSGDEITSRTIRNIISKQLTDEEIEEGGIAYPWGGSGSCSVDGDTVPEAFFFTFRYPDGTETTYIEDKDEITLSDYAQKKGDGYVGPQFCSDSSYTAEIKKIKLTGDNRYTVVSPSGDTAVHDGPIYIKWEYKVNFGDSVTSYRGEDVTFSAEDQTTSGNGRITITDPTMDHYDFAGWYVTSPDNVIEPESTSVDSKTLVLTAPVTLNARWEIKKYKVTINTNAGTTEEKEVEYYTVLDYSPTKEGYTFGGLYKDSGYETPFVCAEEPITKATTLYAKWEIKKYKVTINTNVGATEEKEVAYNTVLDYSPTKEGYTFGGLYKDSGYETQFVCADEPITEDTTLYAKWLVLVKVGDETKQYTAGTSLPETDEFISGQKSACETAATNGGYHFKGFYKDEEKTEPVIFPCTLDSNLTLYPSYESYITVDVKTDETLKTAEDAGRRIVKKVDLGTAISDASFFTEGKDGTGNSFIEKTERYFAGWYNGDSNEKITSETVFPKDTAIYAKWNVSYIIDGSEEKIVGEGTTLSISDLTREAKEGRPWVKDVIWYDSSSKDNQYDSETVKIDTLKKMFYSEEEYYTPVLGWSAPETGGETESVDPTPGSGTVSIDPDSGSMTLPALTSEKYDFAGWYNGETQVKTGDISSSAVDGVKLTQKWSIKKISGVTIGSNTGDLKAGDIVLIYIPEDKGYTVWHLTKATGSDKYNSTQVGSSADDTEVTYDSISIDVNGTATVIKKQKSYTYLYFTGTDFKSVSYSSVLSDLSKVASEATTSCGLALAAGDSVSITVTKTESTT